MFAQWRIWNHWICWLINACLENEECFPSTICLSIILRVYRWQESLGLKSSGISGFCIEFNYFAGKTGDRCITPGPAVGWTSLSAQTIISWLPVWICEYRDRRPKICVVSSTAFTAGWRRWESLGKIPRQEDYWGSLLRPSNRYVYVYVCVCVFRNLRDYFYLSVEVRIF